MRTLLCTIRVLRARSVLLVQSGCRSIGAKHPCRVPLQRASCKGCFLKHRRGDVLLCCATDYGTGPSAHPCSFNNCPTGGVLLCCAT